MRDSVGLAILGAGGGVTFLGDGGGVQGLECILLDVPTKSLEGVTGVTAVLISVLSMEDQVVYAYK